MHGDAPGRPIERPGNIALPGRYFLARDLIVRTPRDLIDGAALRVSSAGVELDLNGMSIVGDGLDPGTVTFGILSDSEPDLVIVNSQPAGGVRGFWCGIQSNATGTRIEQLDLSGNRYLGANLKGKEARFCRNRVHGIGGVTGAAYAVGVQVTAGGFEICENSFRNVYRQPGAAAAVIGEGCAILINSSSSGGRCEGNAVENTRIEPLTIGCFAGGGANTLVRNTLVNFHKAIQGGGSTEAPLTAAGNELRLSAPAAGSIGILADFGAATDNRIVNYEHPIEGTIGTGTGNRIEPG